MHKARLPLTDSDIAFYRTEGYLYIRGFYDPADVNAIHRDVHRLLAILIADHNVPVVQEPCGLETFDSGLQRLITSRRELVSILYDAVKKLATYVALASTPEHERVARRLLATDFVGFANRGYGIRMDNPGEDGYLTQLHQDYTSQLCSPSGVVFWSPLRRVSRELGPVRFYPRSHVAGILPIRKTGEGSAGLTIADADTLARSWSAQEPEVDVGDVLALDFLTLHESTPNRSRQTRWAMLSRYFDFHEPIGRSNGWKGGLQEGNSFERVHPELTIVPSGETGRHD